MSFCLKKRQLSTIFNENVFRSWKENPMIIYDLQCSGGHRFEGWFDDEKAYENQQENGLIACPVCDDGDVSRLPSAFAIKGGHSVPVPGSDAPMELEALKRSLGDYLEKNFDDVGSDFATEALKIHYGVSEKKNIRGTSTKEEEKQLKKEGVPFFKVPLGPPNDSDA
jgi:hypothetical protein